MTAHAIKNKFIGLDETGETLKGLIEFRNKTQDETLQWRTLKNYKITQKYINSFLKQKYKKNDIFLSELNYKFILDFEYFMRKYKPTYHQKPMGNNMVMKHMERIRKMINLGLKREWLEKTHFLRIHRSS